MFLAGLKRLLFAKPLSSLHGISGWILRWLRIVYLAGREFHRNFCFERAATLAYVTIISLIPLAVLFFSFAVQFGVGDSAIEYAKKQLFPKVAPDFQGQLEEWLQYISTSAFKFVGVVGLVALIGLILSAVGILVTAERNFNRVWKVHQSRTYVQKLNVFWVVLTSSPFILIASASVEQFLVPVGGVIERLSQRYFFVAPVYSFLVPIAIGFVAFTVLNCYLPYTRVKLVSAAAGGLFSAILWELLKKSFYVYIARMRGFYGSLAIVPLFLVWIYANWVIVLWGCEVAYAHQNLAFMASFLDKSGPPRRPPQAYIAVSLLEKLARAFTKGEDAPSAGTVAEAAGADLSEVEETARVLSDGGLIVEDPRRRGTFILARDPRLIRLSEVFDLLPGDEDSLRLIAGDAARAGNATGLFMEARGLYLSAFKDRSLEDLVGASPSVVDRAGPENVT